MPSHFKDQNRREMDAQFGFIAKTLQEIKEQMEYRHIENKNWQDSHVRIDHKEIESWQTDHFGQKDDTPHAILDKRLSAHSKRFWWLSGAGAAIGVGLTAIMEWVKK